MWKHQNTIKNIKDIVVIKFCFEVFSLYHFLQYQFKLQYISKNFIPIFMEKIIIASLLRLWIICWQMLLNQAEFPEIFQGIFKNTLMFILAFKKNLKYKYIQNINKTHFHSLTFFLLTRFAFWQKIQQDNVLFFFVLDDNLTALFT